MTIRMDEGEVIAALVGTGIFALAIVVAVIWVLYLLVRPRRRRREQRERELGLSPSEAEQMLRLMERMEDRLEVLERVVSQDGGHEERILEAGEDPELRRIK